MSRFIRHARIAGAAVLFSALVATAPPGMAAEAGKGTLHVYKTPWCGCCTAWAERMRDAGFSVEISQLEDLSSVRRQAGVPQAVAGCHTAVIDGYVVEGHVPAAAIDRLLAERPDVHGIAVPGMPPGSPGMGDDPNARFDVHTFGFDSTRNSRVFFEAGR